MRAKALMILPLVLVGLAALGAVSALAATKSPGLLRPKDLPGNVQQAAPVMAFPTLSTSIVDAAACTETPQSIDGTLGAVTVQFSAPGAAQGATALYEYVAWFPNARTAKTAFAVLSKSDAAAVKCGTVGFIPPKATAPITTVTLHRVKFPPIGDRSFAQSNGAANSTTSSTAVTFVSGPYVALVGTPGIADSPGIKDLKTIVARAEKRLPISTPIPPTTSTTAPKPITVDPVASRCAEEGALVSPASSQEATIAFVNQTGEALRIYWLDFAGARKAYGELAAGATASQPTFVGHVWLLADQSDRCVRVATTDAPAMTVTVGS